MYADAIDENDGEVVLVGESTSNRSVRSRGHVVEGFRGGGGSRARPLSLEKQQGIIRDIMIDRSTPDPPREVIGPMRNRGSKAALQRNRQNPYGGGRGGGRRFATKRARDADDMDEDIMEVGSGGPTRFRVIRGASDGPGAKRRVIREGGGEGGGSGSGFWEHDMFGRIQGGNGNVQSRVISRRGAGRAAVSGRGGNLRGSRQRAPLSSSAGTWKHDLFEGQGDRGAGSSVRQRPRPQATSINAGNRTPLVTDRSRNPRSGARTSSGNATEGNTVIIENFAEDLTREHVEKLCAKYGPNEVVAFRPNRPGRQMKGEAVVVFRSARAAQNAVSEIDGNELDRDGHELHAYVE